MKKRRLTAMLLCLCMTASTITPVLANEESVDTEISLLTESPTEEIGGEFGDGLIWSLSTDTGLLTISGNGAMPRDWDSFSDAPWSSYYYQIVNVIVDEGVSSVAPYAFFQYRNLETIELPSTINSIHWTSFIQCQNLREINITGARNFYSIDGVLFFNNNNEVTLICYPAQKDNTEYTVPDGVTHINSYAFAYTDLEDMNLPDSLKVIYDYAFYAARISTIEIPINVESIDTLVFFASHVENFYVNEDNTYYTSVNGVLYTHDMQQLIAYPTWNIRDTFSVPEGVISIPKYIYTVAYNLKNLYISSTVKEIIETNIYLNGNSMVNIYVDDANKHFSDIDGILFNKDTTVLMYYPPSKPETEYTIPDSTVTIAENSFNNVENIETVIFHKNVSTLEPNGFAGCNNLTSAYFMGDIPDNFGAKPGSNGNISPVFNGVHEDFIIYYPENNTSGWTSPKWVATDFQRTVYNTATFTPDFQTSLSTSFDTTEITLEEGAIFNFEGLVSTTAESGLNDIQININNAETGIGIKYDRRDDIGTQEFDLSDFPSFTTGTTLTGYNQLGEEQKLELTAGTSWNIQIFATDNDGNSIGANIVKKITIAENPGEFLIGKTFNQTSNVSEQDMSQGIPSFVFGENHTGTFNWFDPEIGAMSDVFFYSVIADEITLVPVSLDWFIGGAKQVTLQIIGNDHLKITSVVRDDGDETTVVGCTVVGDKFETELPQEAPTVTGLQDNYTVTQGESLTVNFTVTAGGDGLIKNITLMNSTTGEKCGESVVDAFEPSVTVERTITLSKAGTYNFTVYASADNYTVTDNNVAMFTVTVKEKTDVDEPQSLIERTKYVIVCNEHNTNYKYDGSDYYYGSVTINDNGASAIGIFQWREGRTFDLLNAIVNCDLITQDEIKEILGTGNFYDDIVNSNRNDWSKRKLTSEEAEKVKTLLLTPAGINEQMYMAQKNAEEYCADAVDCGITQEAAKIVYADVRNIGKGYADEIAKSAVDKVGGDGSKVTWELLLEEYSSHEKLSASGYKQRRDRLERLLTEWYGTSTDEPPVVEPDEPTTNNIVIAGVDIGYESGEYFTQNGRACNIDENGGKVKCCHDISAKYLNCVSGGTWTDTEGIYGTVGAVYTCNCMHSFLYNGKTVFLNASQCFAYAKYCSYIVYGKFPDTVYTGVTVEDVKEKLLSVKPGSYLWNSSKTHAIVLVSADENNITYTDANYTGSPCQIRLKTETWDTFKKANYIKNGSYEIYGEKSNAVAITKVTETYSGDIIKEGISREGYLTDGTTSLMLAVEVKDAKRVYMQMQTLSGGSVSGIVPYDKTISEQGENVITTHKWEQVIPNGTPIGKYKVIISASNSRIRNDPTAIKDDFIFYIKITGSGDIVVTPSNEEDVYLTELTNLLNAGEISQIEFNNRKTVLEEASRYCNLEWTAPVSFSSWKGSDGGYNSNANMIVDGKSIDKYKYIQGVTYRGMPYCADDSLKNNNMTISGFLEQINIATTPDDLQGNITFNGINRIKTTLYGIDCAGLVFRSYKALSNYTYSYLGTGRLTEVFSLTSDPKPGDIMLKTRHVMIYVGKSDKGEIMVYESVADGPNGISGCVYRVAQSPEKYKFYSYVSIKE